MPADHAARAAGPVLLGADAINTDWAWFTNTLVVPLTVAENIVRVSARRVSLVENPSRFTTGCAALLTMACGYPEAEVWTLPFR
jgi:hypothetical protein